VSCVALPLLLRRQQWLLISNTLLCSFLYSKTTMCRGVSSANAACAAVRSCLLIHLPDPLNKRWYSTSDLHKFVTDGGFPKLPATLVAKTLIGTRAIPRFKRDKTKNTMFYCFGIGNSEYDSPKSQSLAEVGMRRLPIIAPNLLLHGQQGIERQPP
jgi:hypothetical protein